MIVAGIVMLFVSGIALGVVASNLYRALTAHRRRIS